MLEELTGRISENIYFEMLKTFERAEHDKLTIVL